MTPKNKRSRRPDGQRLLFSSCWGQNVVILKSSMRVVQKGQTRCKGWYSIAYLGIRYLAKRLPWQTNKILVMENPRFRWKYCSTFCGGSKPYPAGFGVFQI